MSLPSCRFKYAGEKETFVIKKSKTLAKIKSIIDLNEGNQLYIVKERINF